jgi:serum/glucocorticoid-regulated kinase 2
MANLHHPFIVKMHYAFESRKYLVFVLEYCSGGELFYLLRKVKRMSEEEAFYYFAEICLGMKNLHDNHIVYRDIKPENILIDFEGHVRIADFGLSKPHMDDQDVAYSFCGSPEYMAPEMLLKSGHNF